ncbi:polysaccharide deacetylase family protein [Pseudalkalibacillus hwajinpoensis]|uniref:polysaccharide deacetylase family protein n=1 Tax=Guptibacillus hwajinpoensis TaxID=208199 RepID=UPI001CD1D9BA|nr:polysaccharide deacetylase family protein [Pseudalkalibacillus hwajinpoensis]MCA0989824.1 polysaccharide deacetylase family protein [Pseudalkalibacillus hwajinpoensis]
MISVKQTGLILIFFLLIGCQSHQADSLPPLDESNVKRPVPSFLVDHRKEQLITKYENKIPTEFGENVSGVYTHFRSSKKEIALTFDACGGSHGNDVDETLISFLKENKLPSTLFINSRWIDQNTALFQELARDPLFQIENHGTHHKPLSVNGQSAWGISGTASVKEVIEEMKENQNKIEELTGKKPTLFRSGTAYYDDVAVQIAQDLGVQIVNYTILGDAGATYNVQQVYDALLQAQPGDIALLHMNQPTSGTAEGVEKAIPALQKNGYTFVHLHSQHLQ